MDRRGFLLGMLATASAPAIVRASSLMPIKVREPYGVLLVDGSILFDGCNDYLKQSFELKQPATVYALFKHAYPEHGLWFRHKDIKKVNGYVEWADSNGSGIILRGNGRILYGD